MNLQEQNRFRERMRDLRIEQEKMSSRQAELESRLAEALARISVLEAKPQRRGSRGT